MPNRPAESILWGNQSVQMSYHGEIKKHTMNTLSRPSSKTGAQGVNTAGIGLQKRNNLPSKSILVSRVQAPDTYTSNFRALTVPRKHSPLARVFPVSSPTANTYEPHFSSHVIWILCLFLVTLSRNKAVKGSNTPLPCLQLFISSPSLCWSEHLVHVQIKTGFTWHYSLIYFLLSWQCRQTMGQGYYFIWHCKLLLDHITPINCWISPSLTVFVRKYSWSSERCLYCSEYTHNNVFVIRTQLKSCDPDEHTLFMFCAEAVLEVV